MQEIKAMYDDLKSYKATLYDTINKRKLYTVNEEHGRGWAYWVQMVADNRLLGIKSRIKQNKRGEWVYVERVYVDVIKIIKL